MKTLCMALTALLVSVSFTQSYAVDLDAPASKKITVRSELNRGKSSAQQCESYLIREIQKYNNCIDDKKNTNEQKNTDTDAFILGLNLRAWINVYMTLDSLELKRLEGDHLWNFREAIAAVCYSEFRRRQAKLKLNDRTIIEASSYKYDKTKDMMSEYEKKKK